MIKFDNKCKSKQQIMAELTLKKIFEEFIVINSKIEYNEQDKFIVKYKHEYKHSPENWIQLMEERYLEL